MSAAHGYAKAARAHAIAESLDIPFGAAWRVAACVSKVRYVTEEDAEAAARSWSGQQPQRAYECDICGKWHLSGRAER